MAHHQLFEWRPAPFGALSVGEAAQLVRAAAGPAARLPGKPTAFDFGREALTPRNLVGMVVAEGASCEILPKVDRDAGGDGDVQRGGDAATLADKSAARRNSSKRRS